MPGRFQISRRACIGLGLLTIYTSSEAYMHTRTKWLIHERNKHIGSSGVEENHGHIKFRSASINGIFVNPFKEYRPQTVFEFICVRVLEVFENLYGSQIELHDLLAGDGKVLKTFEPNYELLRYNTKILEACLKSGNFRPLVDLTPQGLAVNQQLLFTWLGQSCALVQLGGLNILTDPIFSDHLFATKIGPKRLVSSPMSIGDVKYATNGKLDLILVSHNHPDHLEMASVGEIGNSALWVVPLGLKLVLSRKGINNVIEMDWWEKISLNEHIFKDAGPPFPDQLELVFLPAMHWSGRYVIDANTSLWGSFLIRKNKKSILYHAGDTGFSEELFDEIGRRYGPVYLSLLPIGQYCPSWHQRPRHVSPEESIKIGSKLESFHVMGVHFGTFKLSSEPVLEPKFKFLQLAKALKIREFYNVPEFGLTYEFNIDLLEPAKTRPHLELGNRSNTNETTKLG